MPVHYASGTGVMRVVSGKIVVVSRECKADRKRFLCMKGRPTDVKEGLEREGSVAGV